MAKRQAKKTILRKAQTNLDHLAIVNDYAEGALSVPEIARKHKTSEENVSLIAKRFWKSLTNMRETRALTASGPSFDTEHSLKELNGTECINQDFLDKLSDPGAALLTDEEAIYAWTYVHTGDVKEALKLSALDVGLYREKKKDTRFSYDRAMVLRGTYLNAKPNVVSYIKELRESRLIDADIGKARVQSELIDQIEQMKSSDLHKNRTAILRAIELLGKTVGAFVDRVEVREINAGDALDELIEMAQEAQINPVDENHIKEITQ